MGIRINRLDAVPVSEQEVEFVERKGQGHPDTLIDGIVESVSNSLYRGYVEAVGRPQHYNVAKGLIVGGSSSVGFGSGKITKPIEVIVAGRASAGSNGKTIDVDSIVRDTARKYLEEKTRFLDLDSEVVITPKVSLGSNDLVGLFDRSDGVPFANDTSFGVGFAPFTELESLVLGTEKFLNSKEYKAKRPAVGEDIKVMGVREGSGITLTVAIAFVSGLVPSLGEYRDLVERVTEEVRENARASTGKDVEVVINNGDDHSQQSVYITKSGLRAESGDDGQVGRGNRINGLITPFRQMSLEAAAGKNPVSHIGKIYNVLANTIAGRISNEFPDIRECSVSIVSQIGRRIDDPRGLNVNIIQGKGAGEPETRAVTAGAKYIAETELSEIQDLTEEIYEGKYTMF